MPESFEYVVAGLGALGSATCHELARRGHRVLGLERFTLGHDRGASHDSSRILRHSYHTPGYVRLTLEAYDDWARFERDAGTELVTAAGGLDLFPPEPAIGVEDYLDSLDQVGIGYELRTEPGDRRPRPRERGRAGDACRPRAVPSAGGVYGRLGTFGRVLADLAAEGTCGIDLTPYALDRPALTDPTYRTHWLV